MTEKKSCRGVIVKFTEEDIPVEFEEGSLQAVGVVRPKDVTLLTASGKEVPVRGTTADDMARYIQIGDEMECHVTRKRDLEKFTYTKDQEVMENEEILHPTKQVEIQPEWLANKAVVLGGSNKKSLKNATFGATESRLGTILETQVAGETIANPRVSEPSANSSDATTKEGKISSNLESESFKETLSTQQNRSAGTATSCNSSGPTKPSVRDHETTERVYSCANITQLKKPVGKTLREKAKVCAGIMTIVDGKHKGKQLSFANHNLYVWGHHLSRADLSYYINMGDSFMVDLMDNQYDHPILKRGFLGDRVTKKVEPLRSTQFVRWMASRSLDYEAFKRWITDSLERRPFFPLAGDILEGELTGFFKDKSQGKTLGLLKVASESSLQGHLVVFENEDFYLHGVSVGDADVRLFAIPGDRVSCQVRDLSRQEKRRFEKIISEERADFHHVAPIVHMGKRPKSAMVRPVESEELKTVLRSKGWTLQEFEEMREPKPAPPPPEATMSATQARSSGKEDAVSALAAKAVMFSATEVRSLKRILQSMKDVPNAATMTQTSQDVKRRRMFE